MMAILTAVSTVNFNTTINIFTDSQNAISIIERKYKAIKSQNIKEIKKTCNKPNALIAETIIELLTIKNIQWKLTKVKGHSNNEGNDRADKLASIHPADPPRDNITIQEKEVLAQKITLRWDQTHIDAPIKETIKNLNKIKWASTWRTQQRTNEWLNKIKSEEINWPITLNTLLPSTITSTIYQQNR